MSNEYFYQNESEQYGFINVPKAFMTQGCYKKMSTEAKIIYGFLIDRLQYAKKNNWYDEQGKAFIIYPQTEIQNDLNLSERKVTTALMELENMKLIERTHREVGLPDVIYVKSFLVD